MAKARIEIEPGANPFPAPGVIVKRTSLRSNTVTITGDEDDVINALVRVAGLPMDRALACIVDDPYGVNDSNEVQTCSHVE